MPDETPTSSGQVAVRHVPALLDKLRSDAAHLEAAGVHRETLDSHVARIEQAAAEPEPDHGAIETLLTDLRGLVASASNKLVSSGIVSMIDQALGFPAP